MYEKLNKHLSVIYIYAEKKTILFLKRCQIKNLSELVPRTFFKTKHE